MTVSGLYRKRSLKPLPLSCLIHGILLVGAGAVLGMHPHWQEKPVPEAVVEMEVSPEDLPERHVPKASDVNLFAADLTGKQTGNESKEEPIYSESSHKAENAGNVLPLKEEGVAVDTGGAAVSGASGGSDDAGQLPGDVAGGDSGNAGTVAGTAAAGSDSMGEGNVEGLDSIASRFAAQVESNKEYPYMAVRREQTGIVRVTATLSAAGDLAGVYVSGSSGIGVLDDAAIQAVQRSCPFSHGAGQSITLTVPICFDLQ